MQVFGRRYEVYINRQHKLIRKNRSATGYEGNKLVNVYPPNKIVGEQTVVEKVGTRHQPLFDIELNDDESPFYVRTYIEGIDKSLYDNITYLTLDTGSLKITDPIQMQAEVKYGVPDSNGKPQVAKIVLYNLSENTIQQIYKDSTVMIKSGYEQDSELPILFVGDIERVETVWQDKGSGGNRRVTTLFCTEGANVQKKAKYIRSFMKGTDFQDMFNDIILAFSDNGIPLGSFDKRMRDALGRVGKPLIDVDIDTPVKVKTTVQGVVFGRSITAINFNSTLGEAMNQLCDMFSYRWFVSGGRLHIQPKFSDMDVAVDTVDITPDVVIGSIERYSEGKSSDTTDTEIGGIRFRCFHNANIRLEHYINVKYGEYIGMYKPDSISHELDWHSGMWVTTVQALPLTGVLVLGTGGQ